MHVSGATLLLGTRVIVRDILKKTRMFPSYEANLYHLRFHAYLNIKYFVCTLEYIVQEYEFYHSVKSYPVHGLLIN